MRLSSNFTKEPSNVLTGWYKIQMSFNTLILWKYFYLQRHARIGLNRENFCHIIIVKLNNWIGCHGGIKITIFQICYVNGCFNWWIFNRCQMLLQIFEFFVSCKAHMRDWFSFQGSWWRVCRVLWGWKFISISEFSFSLTGQLLIIIII